MKTTLPCSRKSAIILSAAVIPLLVLLISGAGQKTSHAEARLPFLAAIDAVILAEEEDFKTLRNEREQNGYRLIDVETYLDGGKPYWAGVWEKTVGNEHFRLDKSMCDLIKTYHNVYKPDGYELIDLERY